MITRKTIPDFREIVLAAVRAANAAQLVRTPLPDWQDSDVVCRPPQVFANLADHFAFKFEAAGGRVVRGWAELIAWMKTEGLQRGYVAPDLIAHVSDEAFSIDTTNDRALVAEYQFGITRAAHVIAQSGSLMLMESTSSSRLGALTPWVHIAVARVEGILIKGVHGPGVQVCCLLAS